MSDNVKEIVLTGGPCAGKTTGLSFLQENLIDRGFKVFIIPEAASIVKRGGLDLSKLAEEGDRKRLVAAQKRIIGIQMDLRDRFLEIANLFPDEDCILIHDRGPMDSWAYLPEGFEDELMLEIMRDTGYSLDTLRDSFTGVVHLVTAADGAEEYYTTENNKARDESPEVARWLDKRTQRAWVGHSNRRVIDNSTDLAGKLRRTFKVICDMLGIPEPIEIERKFLVRNPPLDNSRLQNAVRIRIEQVYLESKKEEEETRIRKRTQIGHSPIYYLTIKKGDPPKRTETTERISALEYHDLRKKQKNGTEVLRKTRYCFDYENQYFDLDVFDNPEMDAILEVELTEENDAVTIPPFLGDVKEVTENPEFKNFNIAQRA